MIREVWHKCCRALDRGVMPIAPRRHRLAALYWLNFLSGGQERELRYLDRIITSRKVAIDIGANVGLYAYRMSKLFASVYAFEINDELTKDLEAFNPGNITIVNVGLSSQAWESTLYIPVSNGVMLTGWGSLSATNCPEAEKVIEKCVELHTLDSYEIDAVSFIKVDVEGHEIQVLEGARKTIERSYPIVLVETVGENRVTAIRFFGEIGYRQTSLRELIGVDGSEQNCIFIPKRA
jgi:FkbM family methyltransferase